MAFPELWHTLDNAPTGKYESLESFRALPLESSISALKAVMLPRHLLYLAVLVFLTGIGLYELLLWTSRTGSTSTDYRNIFVVFIVTLGLYAIYDLSITTVMSLNEGKKNSEFGTTTLGGFNKLQKLNELEQHLAETQDRLRTVARLDRELQQLLARAQSMNEGRLWVDVPEQEYRVKLDTFEREFEAIRRQRAALGLSTPGDAARRRQGGQASPRHTTQSATEPDPATHVYASLIRR